jgi:hypothetical protein
MQQWMDWYLRGPVHRRAVVEFMPRLRTAATAAKVTGAKDDSRPDSTPTAQTSRQSLSSLGADRPRE